MSFLFHISRVKPHSHKLQTKHTNNLFKVTFILLFKFYFRAAYFGLFDTAVGTVVKDKKDLNFFAAWVIGQFSVVSAGLVSYPWDTIRRRMMMQSGRKDVLYKNSLHCWKKVFMEEGGFCAFYKGAGSNILRGMGSALVLAFYSEITKYA